MRNASCPVCGAEMGTEYDGGGRVAMSCLQCGIRSGIHGTEEECATDVRLGLVVPTDCRGGNGRLSVGIEAVLP